MSLAVNLVEDQFQIMSLLAHLNFTFKVMYRLKQGKNTTSGNNLDKVLEIINQFDAVLMRCLLNYEQLLTNIRKINDV